MIDPASIVLGRLLFDVAQWVYEHVTEAEENAVGGLEKHSRALDGVVGKIVDADLRNVHDKLRRDYDLKNVTDEQIDYIKKVALSQVSRRIEATVDNVYNKERI